MAVGAGAPAPAAGPGAGAAAGPGPPPVAAPVVTGGDEVGGGVLGVGFGLHDGPGSDAGAPGTAGGGAIRGGGDGERFSENDHPSTVPSGGLRLAAPMFE